MTKPHQESCRIAHLWREAVYQAMRDLTLSGEATEAERQDACEWILSGDRAPGSFLWACDFAGLDPDKVRDAVKKREAECSG